MPPPARRAPDTTCSALAVDSAIRGAALGTMWAVATAARPHVLRSVRANAFDFGSFLAIYSGCFCALRRSGPETAAGALAGATAGSFAAVRMRASPRLFVVNTAACSAVGAVSRVLANVSDG